MKYLISCVLACVLFTSIAQASERVKRVIDGDTVDVTRFGRVRLFGVDAPEKKQRLGMEAKAALESLINGERVECIRIGSNLTYNRRVCILVTESGVNLNQAMALLGYAYNEPRYSKGLYVVPEQVAKDKERGVWALDNAVPPWVWRKQR